MASTDELFPLIESLEKEMSELESSLKPIIDGGLAHYTNDMAPIDKAKAYLLSLYALNSTIYSTLKIGEVSTTDHDIMNDIRRVQAYMAKIKNAEELLAGRQLQLDRQAAGRFIKHALSGNDSHVDNKVRRKEKTSEQGGAQDSNPGEKKHLPELNSGHQTPGHVEEQVTKFLREYEDADASEDIVESTSEKKRKKKRKKESKKRPDNEAH
ncbi:hypothetical protein V1525DRAFT_404590 [Lipomyces kononenkoae]|uniref:Uncharacterized protein n=1 Tax=Lipomyces kononenkoae TaxID=34357 RepID=A0ACC3T033_LIPKO